MQLKTVKFKKKNLAALVVAFVVVGSVLLFKLYASGPLASFEAESSVLNGAATVGLDSNASGGKYVQFGSTGSGGTATNINLISNAFPSPEGSGAAESRTYPGVIWAHPDGGATATSGGITYPRNAIYAYKIVNGKLVDIIPGHQFIFYQIDGQTNEQWEDITVDTSGHVWAGQIGSGGSAHYLLKINEPNPASAAGIVNHIGTTGYTRYDYAYPGTFQNSESLFWEGGFPYIVTKGAPSAVYRFDSFNTTTINTLKFIGNLPPNGGVELSGADVSQDHSRFFVGTHMKDWLYQSSNPALSGDAFVLDLIKQGPKWFIDHTSQYGPTNTGFKGTEGFAFVNGHDTTMLTEGKAIYYMPSSFYEKNLAP